MQRKNFLKNVVGLFSTALVMDACKKTTIATDATTITPTTSTSGSCIVAPTETEGPYPYPGGEISNPLNRSDITGGQAGVPITITFTLVNTNNSCALLSGYRIDIWHCNAKGYYSGYGNQPGVLGTQSYVGSTWLRGYQTTDANGQLVFTTIYPGWYASRATHFHFEVYNGSTLLKIGQLTMPETISDAIHVTAGYNGKVNTTRNANDSVFGNSATDLANQTMALTGSIPAGYAATLTIGVAL
jgi:protocatechuate 3,4-dioxygenase beta subunit